MRLAAFRIYNFRSILDTDWQSLSPDNITCLIGQNESGKTSVLEGLNVFYTGEISEDVLRSDMSLPKVSCRFEISGKEILERLPEAEEELSKKISDLKTITLDRVWKEDLSSDLYVGGEIKEFFDRLKENRLAEIADIEHKVMATEHDIEVVKSKRDKATNDISRLEASLPEDIRKASGLNLFKRKGQPIDPEEEKIKAGTLKSIKECQLILDESNSILEKKAEIISELEKLTDLKVSLASIEEKQEEINIRLEERHQTMTLLSGPSMKELSVGEWERVLQDFRSVNAEKDVLEAGIEKQTLKCGYILEGSGSNVAEQKADDLIQKYSSAYSSLTLAEKFEEDIPIYEIFEDFGSLLPNRIDLEDIITENQQVEGYKAARNFLTIAQLDYSFFQQPSSRILKQKIENLNSRLTLDFQDFWQQYVGRKNKIRISFELDHYSTNHGEKAGKPYLEFWVKDEGERLYPKQRSRGVRWFLSFYLELMAASERRMKHLILLVDEPGVSLHARAQEDVLKVFEDIKDNIQVIYTTHSPHLVDIDKLHRVLAIQRDDVENQRSATTILDPVSLIDASPDTLSPLQSIMGNPVGNQEFSVDKFNVIVNDVGTYYLMTAALNLIGYKGRIHFIPSTDPSSIPLMCNILMGWGMSFAILLFNNETELEVAEQLKGLAFTDNLVQQEMIVVMPEGFLNAEDLLSTLDFKNHILGSREGITVSNSQYVLEKNLPRNFLLSKFLSNVKTGKINRETFDEETKENLMLLLNILQKYK